MVIAAMGASRPPVGTYASFNSKLDGRAAAAMINRSAEFLARLQDLTWPDPLLLLIESKVSQVYDAISHGL